MMRSPKTTAAWLGVAALLGLPAPAATAQDTIPPAGRPATLPPPATAEEVQATTPAPSPAQVVTPVPAPATIPAQVGTPAPAPATDEDQERQDRALADSLRDRPQVEASDVTLSVPPGFVRVAIDLDNDGTFDAIDTIDADALLQARRLSAERQARNTGAPGAMGAGPEATGPGQGVDEIRLSGTVQDVQEFRLAGLQAPHRIARLETEQGVAKVDLGSADTLQAMGIEPGAEITVVGHRGTINDRPILMAREVSMGDQSTAIESPEDRMIKRVRGEIRGLRSASFRTHDEEHLIAEVELRNGQQAEVILGPKDRLGELNLAEGTQVSMLVRPARLNGRLAMAAEQVRAGDTAVAITEPVEEPVQTEPGSETEILPGSELESAPTSRGAPAGNEAQPDSGPTSRGAPAGSETDS